MLALSCVDQNYEVIPYQLAHLEEDVTRESSSPAEGFQVSAIWL